MEHGTPLDSWFKQLQDMDDDEAVTCFYALTFGLSKSLLLLNAGADILHNDLKFENLVACEVVDHKECLQLDVGEEDVTIVFEPPRWKWDIKMIDFGTAGCNLPQKSLGITSPSFNNPQVSMCLERHLDSIGNDSFSSGLVLIVGANKGRQIFRDENGNATAPCPKRLRPFFYQAAELHRRFLDKDIFQ